MDKTIAAPVMALNEEEQSNAYSQGTRYARSKLEALAVANDAARILGTEPTFDRWEAYRAEWVAGHAIGNPDLTGNAHDAAWSEFAKLLGTLFGLEKPRAQTVAAVKKAAEREKANEALLAKYQGTPVIELRDKLAKTYEAMAQHPENKDLKKRQKELDKVLKIRTSEENKAHGEELRRLRSEVKAAAGKCIDVEKLEAVLEILDEYTDVAYMVED